MLTVVIRKIFRTKWLTLCLLVGALLATSLLCTIPIYTHGVLQKMLTRDLQDYQVQSSIYPGRFLIKAYNMTSRSLENGYSNAAYVRFDEQVKNEIMPKYEVPVLLSMQSLKVNGQYLMREGRETNSQTQFSYSVYASTDFEEHIKIVHGAMMGEQPLDGVIDAMVTESTLIGCHLTIGEVYGLYYDVYESGKATKTQYARVRVAGTFEPADLNDLYWHTGIGSFDKTVVINWDQFDSLYLRQPFTFLGEAAWYYALDYNAFTVENAPVLAAQFTQDVEQFKTRATIGVPALNIIETYADRRETLTFMLWILQIPVLLMLVFYISMISTLIVEHEKNDIAVQRSRGASGLQIVRGYFYQALLMGAAALVCGPVAGLWISRVLGASNGFMEFVSRKALPVLVVPETFIYNGAGFVLFVLTMVLTVARATRANIVTLKRARTRANKKPLWQKLFLDVVFLGLSVYGLSQYAKSRDLLIKNGFSTADVPVEPLLFVISTMFILGCGLLFIRLYPYVVKLLFFIGRRRWPPVMYASLINVARSSGGDRILMLFLVLTVAMGIFSATSARTINRNNEDRLRYSVGADMALKSVWETKNSSAGTSPQEAAQQILPTVDEYIEPPFLPFSQLQGVDQVTKVLMEDNATAMSGGVTQRSVQLMAITPDEFGRVVWSRASLLPHQINEYLNLMSQDKFACYISASLMEKLGARPGDALFIQYGGSNKTIQLTVYGAVDYWVRFNPVKQSARDDDPYLVVANYAYVTSSMRLRPYEVWIKKSEGTSSQDVYDQLNRAGARLIVARDADMDVVRMKNDPLVQGTNGSLTVSFMFTLAISLMGFLIYWILSIKSRTLQFGILRSMGLSKNKLLGMIVWEQILVSAASVFVGVFVGAVASRLFVPLLELAMDASEQVPPYLVVAQMSDLNKIYIFMGIMLVVGLSVLWGIIRSININQALKLGED